VLVTRERPGELAAKLVERGATVIHVPLIAVEEAEDGGAALRDALSGLADYDWLVVTSPAGSERVGAAARLVPGVRLATVGTATARVLEHESGRPVDLVPRSSEQTVSHRRSSPRRRRRSGCSSLRPTSLRRRSPMPCAGPATTSPRSPHTERCLSNRIPAPSTGPMPCCSRAGRRSRAGAGRSEPTVRPVSSSPSGRPRPLRPRDSGSRCRRLRPITLSMDSWPSSNACASAMVRQGEFGRRVPIEQGPARIARKRGRQTR
jgi:hypothetical protein